MMQHYFKRLPEVTVLAATILGGLIFFSVVSPQNSPPMMLVVGFLFLLVAIYCIVRLAARALHLSTRLKPVPYHGLLIGVSLLPITLLALQSIGQLTPRDVITLAILFVAGYFYVSRMYGDGSDGSAKL